MGEDFGSLPPYTFKLILEGRMRYQRSGYNHEYIVIKHSLKGVNTDVLGIRYRDGYGVVAKGSKTHVQLKRIKLAITEEYPITFLENLACVTNDTQIKYIWGKPVYDYYLKQKFKVEHKDEIKVILDDLPQCEGKTAIGEQCKRKSLTGTEWCKSHLSCHPEIGPELEASKAKGAERKKVVNALIKKYIKQD